MKNVQWGALFVIFLLLASCGVPRTTADLARSAAAATMPADPQAVRAALRQQSAQWDQLAGGLRQAEPGGILFVDARFIALIERTAAAARCQVALMDAEQDDPQKNAQLLREFQALWKQAADYLAD